MQLTLEQQLLLAPQVAARAHAHQKRKDGTPYIAHPVRVALRVTKNTQSGSPWQMTCQIGAFLHDVVEDTDVTLDDLRELGFSEGVLAVIDRVTKRPGEKYKDFILRIKGDGLSETSLYAIAVKLADIDDNVEDQSALDPEEAEFLRERYERAREVLEA
jgi:(p)ppGpp synthase/HD superfamily hydrolase